MTSIFSGKFTENLQRVYSRSAQPEQKPESHPTRFSEMLAKLETPAEKIKNPSMLSNPQALPAAPEAKPEDVLTNIPLDERARLKGPEPATGKLVKPHAELPQIPILLEVQSVKASTTDVKIPPVPTLLEGSVQPQTPKLLEVTRLEDQQRLNPKLDIDSGDVRNVIAQAGKYHGVDPLLSLAVAEAESSLRSDAVSSDGHHSKGLFQLLDSTGKDMMASLGVKSDYDPFDPDLNAMLGVGYLRILHNIFSEETTLTRDLKSVPAKSADDLEKLAIAAFNAGQGNVARAQQMAARLGEDPSNFEAVGRHLPASTRAYVDRVLSLRAQYESSAESSKLA